MRTLLPSATAKRAKGEPMYADQELDSLDSLLSSIARGGLRGVVGRAFRRERTGTGIGHAREEKAIASYHGRPEEERAPSSAMGPGKQRGEKEMTKKMKSFLKESFL